jgi:hypothetical protein
VSEKAQCESPSNGVRACARGRADVARYSQLNSSAYLSQVRERPKVTQAPLIRSHDLLVIEEHPPGIRGADMRDVVARVYRGDFVRD